MDTKIPRPSVKVGALVFELSNDRSQQSRDLLYMGQRHHGHRHLHRLGPPFAYYCVSLLPTTHALTIAKHPGGAILARERVWLVVESVTGDLWPMDILTMEFRHKLVRLGNCLPRLLHSNAPVFCNSYIERRQPILYLNHHNNNNGKLALATDDRVRQVSAHLSPSQGSHHRQVNGITYFVRKKEKARACFQGSTG